KRRRAHACQARAGIDDLPGEFAVLERSERCLAGDRLLAVQRQWQRRAGNEIERVGRGPDQRFSPYQTPFRRSERTLGENHVEPSRVELSDQLRTDADLHLELHAWMERGEATKCRRQRAPGDLFDHAETYRAGQARGREAQAGSFLEFQQATCVAE